MSSNHINAAFKWQPKYFWIGIFSIYHLKSMLATVCASKGRPVSAMRLKKV